MQIKFLTFYDLNTDPIYAQNKLLKQWHDSIVKNQIKFIKKAIIAFTEYKICEYTDQLKIEEAIINSGYKDNLEEIYKELNNKKRIMELIITVEDVDYD